MKVDDIIVGDRFRKELGDIESLARSIDELGLLQPIVVRPDNTLVAGFRRLHAVRMLGWQDVPVTIAHGLDDELRMLKAERDENTCRKDLVPTEAVYQGRRIEEREKKAAQQRQESQDFGRGVTCGKFPQVEQGKTRDKVGEAIGMSGRTWEKAKQVVEAAEGEPKEFGDLPKKMDSDSIHGAYREMQKRKRKKRQESVSPLPEDKYRVIYADPPWFYRASGVSINDNYGGATKHYQTMTIEELCDMPVRDLAAQDSVLFIWVTSPKLNAVWDVIDAWGFEYKTSFVWDKVKHNFGYYNSVRHEFLLICGRGSSTPDTKKLIDSVQSIERTEKHSEKPEEFREIIDYLYPNGKRIELFARTNRNDNWEYWGDEADIQSG